MHTITTSHPENYVYTDNGEGSDETSLSGRHWLLDAVYGRGLLKLQLHKTHPDIPTPVWRDAPELDPLLEQAVDALGVRAWRRPSSFVAKCHYLRDVVQLAVSVRNGDSVPRRQWGE
jgi:hypothetical protein